MTYRPIDSASFVDGDIVQQIGGLLTGVNIGKVHQGVRLHSAGTVTAYANITAALAAAAPADTVILGPGTYNESISIPDGVRVVGTAPAEEIIIAGADATSSRVTFLGTGTLREVTVQAPSAGANPAINCNIGAGKLVVVFNTVIQGGGGTGAGLYKDGAGILVALGGFYHNGGPLGGPLVQVDAGTVVLQELIANVGSCTSVLQLNGGIVEARDWLVQPSTLYACTNLIEITAASTLVILGIQNSQTSPAPINGVNISGDGVEFRCIACDLFGQAYDFLIGGGVTGVGSHLDLSSCHFRYERLSFPVAFASNATIHAIFLDDADQNDPAFRIISELSVGSPELPRESVFGEGNSTVNGMVVYSFDGVATWVDNTPFARTAAGSTFNLFQGTGAGQVAYVGNLTRDFNGIRVECTGGMVLGAGAVVVEYWNGAAWVEFNTVSTQSSNPFTQYANAYLRRAQSEHLRFDYQTMLADWATTVVNGTTAYWIRFRVTSNITTVPVLERFKLGTNRTEINDDGTLEFFGLAQPRRVFWRGTGENLSVPSGGANAPSTLDVSLSPNVSYRQINSLFVNGSDSRRAGTMIQVPDGLDTSKPLLMDMAFLTDGTNTNPVRWDLYVAQVVRGSLLVGALDETLVTNATLPSAANGVNEVHLVTFEVSIEDLTPGDFFAFTLWRKGATDANTDSAGVLALEWSGYYLR